MLDAAATLLRALAAEGPLLIVIDDLQWASEELLEAIGEVAKRLRGPILLVLVGREPATIADLPSPRQLDARPAGREPPPTGCCAPTSEAAIWPIRCARRCSAGPRAIRTSSPNCCTCWSTAGLLQREGDSWVASGPLPADALPAAVQSVLAARIDGLDPAAKSVLRAASVLGLRFAAEALGVVDQRSTDEVQAALDELTARQLVRPPNKGELWWTFTHPMARDVAYGSLPKADRARRHARAALWAAERGARVGSTQVDPFVGCPGGAGARARRIDGAAGRRSGTRGAVRRVRRPGTPGRAGPRSATSTATPRSCWPARSGSARKTSPRSW